MDSDVWFYSMKVSLFTLRFKNRDLSFAAHQYERYGQVTNSMFLTVVYRAIIVAEYFYFEHWYAPRLYLTESSLNLTRLLGSSKRLTLPMRDSVSTASMASLL